MPTLNRRTLADLVSHGAYQGYSYSYPHKTAYRMLSPAIPLSEVWADENRDALFFYIHVPFCEFRCGFCNLFTQANPDQGLTARYLEQLRLEAERVRSQVDNVGFARLAIGGGTPTFLEVNELQQLFSIPQDVFDIDFKGVPSSVEVSPPTISRPKLQLLEEYSIDRISIGVQSFDDNEVHHLGRPQKANEVQRALDLIREFDFASLNIDLIYGAETQTVESWLSSVRKTLRFSPEEIYLYPLYVRPLTGLGRLGKKASDVADDRLEMYRAARDELLAAGYQQSSLRMFSRSIADTSTSASGELLRQTPTSPEYSCQADGMIGLGCGARSYTTNLHYSTEYAVGHREVRGILADYISREPATFETASFGHRLSIEDQQRRYVIQSLLQTDGLDRSAFAQRFETDALNCLAELKQLIDLEFAQLTDTSLKLTPAGIEQSDVIGPWLYSAKVNELTTTYETR